MSKQVKRRTKKRSEQPTRVTFERPPRPFTERKVVLQTKKGPVVVEHFYAKASALPLQLRPMFPRGAAVLCENASFVAAIPASELETDHMYQLLKKGETVRVQRFIKGLCKDGTPNDYTKVFFQVMDAERQKEPGSPADEFVKKAMEVGKNGYTQGQAPVVPERAQAADSVVPPQ